MKNLTKNYSILRIKEVNLVPLIVDKAPNGQCLTTGSDLNELGGIAYELLHEKYNAIDSYEKWIAMIPDGVEDVIIVAPAVGEVFRASILIEEKTRQAFALAQKYHHTQVRKAGGQQYIIHIMMIARMLWGLFQRGQIDRATLLAGICHDLLEDTTCSEKEIADVCGHEVLSIVKVVSNDPELEDQTHWEQKKEKYIQSVAAGGDKAITVALADKIVNMQSLFAQYDIEGSAVWEHFNRGKEKKVWFEHNLLVMVDQHLNNPLVQIYKQMITKLEGLDGNNRDQKDR